MALGMVFGNSALVEAILHMMDAPGDKLRAYVAFGKYAKKSIAYRSTAKVLFNAMSVLDQRPTILTPSVMRIVDCTTGSMLMMTVPPVTAAVAIPDGSGNSVVITDDALLRSAVFHAGRGAVCMAVLVHDRISILQAGGASGWRLIMHFALAAAAPNGRIHAAWADASGDIHLMARVNSGSLMVAFRISTREGVIPTMVVRMRDNALVCACQRTSVACVSTRNTSDLLFVRLHDLAVHKEGSLLASDDATHLGDSKPEHMSGLWCALQNAALITVPLRKRRCAAFADRATRCTAVAHTPGTMTHHAYIVERWIVENRPCWLVCRMQLPPAAAGNRSRRRTVLTAFAGPCPLWSVVMGNDTFVLAEHNELLLVYRPGFGVRRLRTESGIFWPGRGGVSLAEYLPVSGCNTLLLRRTDNSGEAVIVDIDRLF